ncbi:hypothetical protein [Edaphobacter modestus]|uniref:hypothetical protein n=1 Tax=Edaphobacter modestus TaxID=388466 RepID=UPI0013EE4CE3|nr:hypothetical protein [Edaphobacter modestus]
MLPGKGIARQWMDDIVFKRFVTNSVTVSPYRNRSVGPGTEPFTAVASRCRPVKFTANNQ